MQMVAGRNAAVEPATPSLSHIDRATQRAVQ